MTFLHIIIFKRKKELSEIKNDFYNLFSEKNAQDRGKKLESVLNSLFKDNGILVREAFTVNSETEGGIAEQVDDAIEIDGNIYLVEIKWLKGPVDKADISQHLVRIYHRGYARGIFISASDYTRAAIDLCKEALQKTVISLCRLEEFVKLLEQEKDLKE